MYKKLLNENVKNFGGVNNFIVSLRKEVTIWKLAFAVLSLIIMFFYVSNEIEGGNSLLSKFKKIQNEPITTKQINYLSHDVIAEIRIEDVILPDLTTEKLLDEIEKSKKIKGLLVVINSPGGDPTASEVIHDKLKKIGTKIPVVSFIQGYGASGGYMIAMAGHKIVAVKTAVVGSIGVISGRFDFSELMKKVGVSYDEYATSEYKGAGNQYKKQTEVQQKYIQEITTQIFEVFKSMVKESRNLTEEELSLVDNAKVFVGKHALKLKLVDEIGSKESALNIIKEKLKEEKLENTPVQEINKEQTRPNGFFDIKSLVISFLMYLKTAIIK